MSEEACPQDFGKLFSLSVTRRNECIMMGEQEDAVITIDPKRCIGCGLCAEDCFTQDIEITEGKANPRRLFCLECGHCQAVCPVGAVTLTGDSAEEIIRMDPGETLIDPDRYLRWIRTRRTIRRFTQEKVSPEDLHAILEVGRFSPTGGNLQNVAMVVIEDSLPHVRKLALESLYRLSDLTDEMKKIPNMIRYAQKWKEMYAQMRSGTGDERLFFGAPCVMLLVSPSCINASIAAAHMETMVYALGLGMVYSGFTTRAVNASPELKAFLGLKEEELVQASFALGHPAVRYYRGVSRAPRKVIRR